MKVCPKSRTHGRHQMLCFLLWVPLISLNCSHLQFLLFCLCLLHIWLRSGDWLGYWKISHFSLRNSRQRNTVGHCPFVLRSTIQSVLLHLAESEPGLQRSRNWLSYKSLLKIAIGLDGLICNSIDLNSAVFASSSWYTASHSTCIQAGTWLFHSVAAEVVYIHWHLTVL